MLFQYDEGIVQHQQSRCLSVSQRKILSKQGLKSGNSYLFFRPKQYVKRSYYVDWDRVLVGQLCAFIGVVQAINRRYVRKNLTIFSAQLNTNQTVIPITWFNQHYILDKLQQGSFVVAYGKKDNQGFETTFQVQWFETYSSFSLIGDGLVFPIYADIKGVSNKVLVRIIQGIINESEIIDCLPQSIQKSEGLVDIQAAFQGLHFPQSQDSLDKAIRRLSFDERFIYMFPRRKMHQKISQIKTTFPIQPIAPLIKSYLDGLPYSLTAAQQRIWDQICEDFEKHRCVFRLIQGDVGSGKTDIANLALLSALANGYQAALLVPTEILAQQHYHKLCQRCKGLSVHIYRLTGRQSKKDRDVLQQAMASNQPLVVVGTHALVQESVIFSSLALVVIDEQHRFGVFQRQTLLEKSNYPHCLFMTATPIPRTLMLTHYGDLDHDIIDQMPPGRQPIKTYYGKKNRLKQVVEFIRLALRQGRQAYVVYPLIDHSNHLKEIQPALDGFDELSLEFSEWRVGLLHGKMPNKDKETVMLRFKKNEIQLLVSTTVVEVGVDVPNATIMVIMNAERFGLSQLHQLRGRVGRGAHQSHCFLVANPQSLESKQRIQAMVNSTNGFELAEQDLKIRGPGNMLGSQQSGDVLFSFTNTDHQNILKRVTAWCDQLLVNSNVADIDDRLKSILLSKANVSSELLN